MSMINGGEDSDASNADCGGGTPSMSGGNIEGSADDEGCGLAVIDLLNLDITDINMNYTHEAEMAKKSGSASEPFGYSLTNAQDHLEEAQWQFPVDNGNRTKSCSFWAQNDSHWVGDWGNRLLEPSNISMECEKEIISKSGTVSNQSDDGDNDESVEDSDDDISDDYDSDSSHESYELQMKNRWFRRFFETMDSLDVEEVKELNRRWHCPACHDGPGAIAWYKGLQPLIAHAKTKKSLRMKLHRKFAELLEMKLERRRILNL